MYNIIKIMTYKNFEIEISHKKEQNEFEIFCFSLKNHYIYSKTFKINDFLNLKLFKPENYLDFL
jgi:hypothetical protein